MEFAIPLALASLSAALESLPEIFLGARFIGVSGVAAFACLAYDILISFDEELEYIWKSAWRIPKCLYLFSRYFALVVQLTKVAESTSFFMSDNYCQGLTYFTAVTGQLVIMSVEILLMMRICALYKHAKRILVPLLVLYFLEVLANSLILGLALKKVVPITSLRSLLPPGFPLPSCFPTSVPQFFFSYWIPTFIFESVLFILMCIDFVRFTMSHKIRVHLLTLFVRDGSIFFAVIFVMLLTQVLLYDLVHSALAQIAIPWQLTVFSIAGSHLILSLRANAAQPTIEEFNLTGIRFEDSNSY